MRFTRSTSLDILLWHVHGSWTTSFVQGRHRYLLPTLPDSSAWGRGRGGRDWPDSAREVAAADLAATEVDLVVLQRPEELELAQRWLARAVPGEVPAVYVEHHAPHEHAATTVHHLAARHDIPVVHVTHFNELMWDSGYAPTVVIPHGIVDPGHLYSGELPRAGALINEANRRRRVTGTDLLEGFASVAPVDVFGIDAENIDIPGVTGVGDLRTPELHQQLAQRRAYVHTARWTSLGLSLLEAMQLGMPVVAPATTEAIAAVAPGTGVISTDIAVLQRALRDFADDPDLAADRGKNAREHALTNFGLPAFLDTWDTLCGELTR
ncbi:glycosyltransferase [Phytomonospora sp. NPDC050363]|uniref:glycosyltransferase n=1 Tax=Phytomonospora sp. NPDC050363 TaxID=3155642 RepID=UPI0033CA1FA2